MFVIPDVIYAALWMLVWGSTIIGLTGTVGIIIYECITGKRFL